MMRPGVGVGVFVKKDNRFLIQKRIGAHGEGTWCLPGGHLEYGETPEQTAARETKEEVNVDIQNAKVVGVTNDFMPDHEKHYITIFVEAEYAGGEARIMEPDKLTEIRWCEMDDLPEPLFIPFKNFVQGNRML